MEIQFARLVLNLKKQDLKKQLDQNDESNTRYSTIIPKTNHGMQGNL